MLIGLPKEIKDNENRVGLTPGAVKALTRDAVRRYWYRVERAQEARFQMKNISLPALKLFPTRKMRGLHKWWLR